MSQYLTQLSANNSRPLTPDEIALARTIFGESIDYARVCIHRRRWWCLQPRRITMAPDGHLWFHPEALHYRDCFASADINLQGHFIHEMTHVWQAQQRGKYWLPLMRHPFCRYAYTIVSGRPFASYGVEQQAEIVRHAFLLDRGAPVAACAPLATYRAMIPFCPA